VSPLGRQLSESALRASQRELEMPRAELAAYAKKQKYDFLFDGYKAGKARHDLELPKSAELERLERARRATDFINCSDRGAYAKNPFAGLSRDQLVLIAYDDSGSYTMNERRAAWYGSSDLESEWARGVVARGRLESNSTGRVPKFLKEVLDHYKVLPRIEKVQERYPENYVAEMEEKIRAELSLPSQQDRRVPERVLNLYDILAGIGVLGDQGPVPMDRRLHRN